jgi:hypothetical protein
MQPTKLALSTDGSSLNPFNTARHHPERVGLGAADEIGLNRLSLTLHPQRSLRRHLKEAPHITVGAIGDQDPAGRSRRLQSRGYICSITHRGQLGMMQVAHNAKQCRAGVNAHSHRKAHTMPEVDPFRIVPCFRLDLQAATHGTFRIILVSSRRAEECQDRITHQPRYQPIVPGDHMVHERERAVHQLGDILRVQSFSHTGGADDICEKEVRTRRSAGWTTAERSFGDGSRTVADHFSAASCPRRAASAGPATVSPRAARWASNPAMAARTCSICVARGISILHHRLYLQPGPASDRFASLISETNRGRSPNLSIPWG